MYNKKAVSFCYMRFARVQNDVKKQPLPCINNIARNSLILHKIAVDLRISIFHLTYTCFWTKLRNHKYEKEALFLPPPPPPPRSMLLDKTKHVEPGLINIGYRREGDG